MLTRDQILAADDIGSRVVEVPEWGGTVRCRGLTGRQRAQLTAATAVARGERVEMRVDMLSRTTMLAVAYGVVDEDDKPLFTKSDVDALGEKAAGVLDMLAGVIFELSGMNQDAKEATRGNSKQVQNGSSTTG